MKENHKKTQEHRSEFDRSRRDFLRKSVYAAYATPVITALLVEQASAKKSKDDAFCADKPWHPLCPP